VPVGLRCRGSLPSGLEIAGSQDALKQLANWIDAGAGALSFEKPETSPAPYERWLARLTVAASQHPLVKIGIEDDTVCVVGGQTGLATLAENIRIFADDAGSPDEHLHIDYYPGHFFLAEESVPLVVARR
jgi:hypothetical protein